MQYGDTNITDEKLYLYQGFDPATVNLPPHNDKLESKMEVVNQRDAEILFMWEMVFSSTLTYQHYQSNPTNNCVVEYINNSSLSLQYKRLDHQTEKKREILEKIAETVKHRNHLDGSVELIGVLLFGPTKGSSVLQAVRATGLPVVDDWECLKSRVYTKTYLYCYCYFRSTTLSPEGMSGIRHNVDTLHYSF